MFRDYPKKISSEELEYLILLSNKDTEYLDQLKNSGAIKQSLISKGYLTADGRLKNDFEDKLKPQLKLFPRQLTKEEVILFNKLHSLVKSDRDVIKITDQQLQSIVDFGRSSIDKAVAGLENKQLMFVMQERDNQGRFSHNRITLFDNN